MADQLTPLGTEGIQRFRLLRPEAVKTVAEQIYVAHGRAYDQFGPRGREACHEDLAFHLEFLEPVLEFGLLQPMVEYLRWLNKILEARGVPADHLALSLDLLAAFFAQNMDAAEAVAVTAALQAAREQFLEVEDAQTPAESPEPWPEVEQFVSALLAGDQSRALAVMNHCLDSGRDLVEGDSQIIKPALYQIGERWQANQVSVAQEHLATAIAQSVMTAGLLRSPPLPMIGKRVLLTCVAGNEHAVGARMVADAFQLGGWDVHYLGANVPTSAIVRHAVEYKPDLVGLSVSFPQQLRVVKEIIVRLGEQLGSARPAVIIGGLAINRFNRLVDVVGADACSADPRATVAYAGQLVTGGKPDALVPA